MERRLPDRPAISSFLAPRLVRVEGSKIADGLPAKVIQERLGRATMAETMDTYGHLFPDASEHGRSALDAMFAPAGVRPMCARQRS